MMGCSRLFNTAPASWTTTGVAEEKAAASAEATRRAGIAVASSDGPKQLFVVKQLGGPEKHLKLTNVY